MKKLGLFILLLSWALSASFQSTFFTPELKQELQEYLAFANDVDKDDNSYQYFMRGIIIINLLTDCNIDKVDDDYLYGIYKCVALYSPTSSQILLKREVGYKILNVSRPIVEAINDLYFKEHPDIPKSLYLLYVGAVYRVYMENRYLMWLNNISVKDEYLDILQNYEEIRPYLTIKNTAENPSER